MSLHPSILFRDAGCHFSALIFDHYCFIQVVSIAKRYLKTFFFILLKASLIWVTVMSSISEVMLFPAQKSNTSYFIEDDFTAYQNPH